MQDTKAQARSPLLYVFMLLLAAGFSFIGFNFGGITGAIITFFFSCIANTYVLTIKPNE